MAKDKPFSKAFKLRELSNMLEQGAILAHVDPAIPGTSLPSGYASNPTVALKLNRAFKGDLQLDADQVRAELLFAGQYFSCVLPVDAIWAVTDSAGENHLWPNSDKQEVLKDLMVSVSKGAPTASPKVKSVKPKRGHLKRVK